MDQSKGSIGGRPSPPATPEPKPAASKRERNRIQLWQWKDSRLVFKQCGTEFNSIGSVCTHTSTHTHTLKKKTAAGMSPPRNSHMKERVEGVSVCVVVDSKRTKCLSVHVCAAEDQVCVGICVCVG